jgi:hypothetical protein
MRILLATKNAIYTFEKEYARWRAVSPGSAWLIPIFRADFPCFTSKIAEYSRYLPEGCAHVKELLRTTGLEQSAQRAGRTEVVGNQTRALGYHILLIHRGAGAQLCVASSGAS